jgi:glutamyl-tRNA synthetase
MEVHRPRGRYAPSPTGEIHVGNARTALVAWWSVRSRGGSFVWRLEDLDPPRTIPGMAEAAERDLRWLGMDWDEGPKEGGPFAPYEQSRRSAFYEAALRILLAQGRLFPCRLSRKDLKALASAPHGPAEGSPYPASLRPRDVPTDWLEGLTDAAIRFSVKPTPVVFQDRLKGRREERVDQTVGDFVLKRRDGLYAYQLAVVVDDLAMGIDEVVRGEDLLGSTARQIQLIEALGAQPPAYAHVPLVVNAAGEKLSKRDQGLTLAALRESGVTPEALVGYLAYSLGLLERPEPQTAAEIAEVFSWDRLASAPPRYRMDWPLPEDLAAELRTA